MPLNLQEMAQSAYNIINSIQNTATELVGIDALWCRATPEENSEDVILQEYTLTNVGVECPKAIRVLTSQADYNPGNFTVDLFGVNYDAPLEVSITIAEWKQQFGDDSMPQQGDIVYIKLLHKLFEVRTSQVIYTIASMPTYYKCQLSKYVPTASRKPTEELKLSIDELTVSQETLFGDAISQEVADNNVEVETAYNTTSYVDPMKDFDMNSIVFDELSGPNGVLISSAYYDMVHAEQPVVYHTAAHYYAASDRPHWIFTCWFRAESSVLEQKEYSFRSFIFFMKDKKYWYFKYTTALRPNVGDKVTIKRGSLITVTGDVVEIPNDTHTAIRIKVVDIVRTTRKLSNWYDNPRQLKVMRATDFNIIKSDNGTFSIDYIPSTQNVDIVFGESHHTFAPPKSVNPSDWTYLAVDLTAETMEVVMCRISLSGNQGFFIDEFMHEHKESAVPSGDFEFETLSIDACETALNIRNIRLYENEYAMGNTYNTDMLSRVTSNASKLILVDGPNIKENRPFVSPVR